MSVWKRDKILQKNWAEMQDIDREIRELQALERKQLRALAASTNESSQAVEKVNDKDLQT